MFDKKCLTLGLISMCVAVFASFCPALYLYFAYGVIPSGPDIASIASLMVAGYGVGWILQPITFYPAMGVGGSLASWTTGNVSDLRMPAVSAAQKSAGVEGGTPEGTVIATMGAATSNVLTVIWLTFITFIGSVLISLLPASVKAGFSYIAPAIFGAIIVGIINNIQTLLGVDSNIQRIVKGAIIVVSVIIDVVTKNSAKKAR